MRTLALLLLIPVTPTLLGLGWLVAFLRRVRRDRQEREAWERKLRSNAVMYGGGSDGV